MPISMPQKINLKNLVIPSSYQKPINPVNLNSKLYNRKLQPDIFERYMKQQKLRQTQKFSTREKFKIR